MPQLAETTVTLRIFGDTLEPDEITRLMDVEPSHCSRKGETRRSKSREYVNKSGSWLLEYDLPGDLDVKIGALLAQLPSDPSFWRDLNAQYQCDVFCGLFMDNDNEGKIMQHQLLLMLGERGLTLQLDIYGPASSDDELDALRDQYEV